MRTDGAKGVLGPYQVDGVRFLSPSIPGLHSGEEGDALPQLRPTYVEGGDGHGVDHHQDQADVYGGVLQPLPGESVVGKAALHLAYEALNGLPEPLVDDPHPLGTLHVDAILDGEHIGRVPAAGHPPPGDDVAHLPLLHGVEDVSGLELAVADGDLHLQVIAENPV